MEIPSIESKIEALTLSSESAIPIPCAGNSNCYYDLDQAKIKNKEVLEKLQQERLKYVLQQLQKEREDVLFSRNCLFCKKHFSVNRSFLFTHLMEEHNLHIGAPDNVVFGNELLDILEEMLQNLKCFYCEKTFKDWQTLKEHMRKKQHKRINPRNKTYDRFYIINYLELGKTWSDVQEEDDGYSQEDTDGKEAELMECEDDDLGYVCLFCERKLFDLEKILSHMKDDHQFDFLHIKQSQKLDFYKQVKLINYIRRRVFEKKCTFCESQFAFHSDLMKHIIETGHISLFPAPANWDQTMYYFSTFENDNLLCALDDEGDNDCQDETLVYPEDTVHPFSTLLQDESIRKTLV